MDGTDHTIPTDKIKGFELTVFWCWIMSNGLTQHSATQATDRLADGAVDMFMVNEVLVMLLTHRLPDGWANGVITTLLGVQANPWFTVTEVAPLAMVAVPAFLFRNSTWLVELNWDAGISVSTYQTTPDAKPVSYTHLTLPTKRIV